MRRSNKPLWLRARDFARYRSRPLRGWVLHTLWRPLFGYRPAQPLKLHVGSGMERLEGWVNIDLQKLPEVDLALDVLIGLPFQDVEVAFAEHFLEHLEVADALKFLIEIRRALAPGGRLRLSTPNLDWVWANVYRVGGAADDRASHAEGRLVMGIHANRSFYGWGHRFLWTRPLLDEALTACGYRDLVWCRHGDSELPEFQGLEQHETYNDTPEVPHVLVVEAIKGEASPEALATFRRRLQANFLDYMGN
jgi:predicted SAM-dependent methyltransferase